MKLLSLEIDKMAGVDRVSFSKEDLISGINVIFGPNGSGKTSICRAITKTLWPETLVKGERLDLRSIWHTDNGHVTIDMETGVQKTSSLVNLPPSYLSRCFVITIDDLFDAKDQDLATRILQEAHGGYDPEEVRKAFKLTQRLGREQSIHLTGAKEALRKVESKHVDLAHQEKDLKEMQHQLEEMKKMIAKKGPTQNAQRAHHLEIEIKNLVKEMEGFPPGVEFIKLEDKETLNDLRQKEAGLKFHLEKLASQIKEHEEKIQSFSQKVLTDEAIALFDKTVQEIHHLSGNLERLAKEKAKLEVDLQEKLRFLMIEEGDFETIDLLEMEKIADLFARKEKLTLQEKELYARLDVLVQDTPPYPVHTLLSGIAILKALSVSQGKEKPWTKWFLGSQVAFFAACGLFSSPIFFFGLVFPIISWQLFGKYATNRKNLLEEYASLGLPDLDEKQIASVLDDFLFLVGKRQRYELDSGLVIDAEKRLSFVEEEKNLLEEELANTAFKSSMNSSFAYFLEDLTKAKQIYIELLQKKRESLDSKKTLDAAYSFLEDIASCVVIAVCSPSSVQVILDDLRKKRDEMLSLTYKKKGLEDDQHDKQLQIAQIKKQIEAFFEKRKISSDDQLFSHLDLLSRYLAKKGIWQEKTSQKLLVENDKSLFPDLFEKSSDELTESLFHIESLEKKYEEVLTEKAQLEERIYSAKKGHELAQAKKEVENGTRAVKEKISESCFSVMGEFLLQKVESSYRQESSLVVFDKICEYFSVFTKGKYIFKAARQVGKETEFFVEDTENHQNKKLGILSRGTRMQLLLAVRIAFSDLLHSEPLPLFLDEALHTADGERFGAIASVLFELASRGRQIFYLTSKFSDIGLLQGIAKDLGKEISYIDLESKKN